jgi:Na+-driven multidrug efflux pump
MYYQAIEIPKYSNIICAMRSILILPVVLVVLYKAFGVNGIWISMAVSELLIILIVDKSFKINKCTQRALSEVTL